MLNHVLVLTLVAIQALLNFNSILGQPFDGVYRQNDLAANVCFTPACLQSASYIRQNMDTNTNPCDDFYQFACGRFMDERTIRDEDTTINSYSLVADKIRTQLKKSLMKLDNNSNYTKTIQLAKNLYDNCMDKDASGKKSIETLLMILEEAGSWPVLKGDQWDSSNFNWIDTIVTLNGHGFDTDWLLKVDISIDPENITKRVIFLGEPLLQKNEHSEIKYDDYLTPEEKKLDDNVFALHRYMYDITSLLGAHQPSAFEEMGKVTYFMNDLKKIQEFEEENQNNSIDSHRITVSRLNIEFPSIPWIKFLNAMLPLENKIDENEFVFIQSFEYIKKLETLIHGTPNRVLANFIMWKTVDESIQYFNGKSRNEILKYSKAISGQIQNKPRWEQCIVFIENKLPISAGALYIQDHFNITTRKKSAKMTLKITKTLEETLEQLKWMDSITKSKAIEKVKFMALKIAFPRSFLIEKSHIKYYQGLELSENSFLGNILSISRFFKTKRIRQLRKPVRKHDWMDFNSPTTVNAFYSLYANQLKLPSGILRDFFFDHNRPQYLNFGTLGSTIGHEVFHGFDSLGMLFDKDGKMQNWWEDSTVSKYYEVFQCIVDYYQQYTVNKLGQTVNGAVTLDENIADIGGLKLAYLAYKNWSKNKRPELKLPRLNYTSEQMFWISTANTFCEKNRKENDLNSNPHAPAAVRVQGSFSNVQEFATDFNCAVGSNMNPVNRCIIFD